MSSDININKFIAESKDKALVAGYGSLLSQYSREKFSSIYSQTIDVKIEGWQRGWLTRSLPENQTYASAVASVGHTISAKLIPLVFDKTFEEREQDYRFTKINRQDVSLIDKRLANNASLLSLLEKTPIYICESIRLQESDHDYPVHYSYVDTCLAGSFESAGVDGVNEFFKHTHGWQRAHFIDDSMDIKYPRASPCSKKAWDTKALIKLSAF